MTVPGAPTRALVFAVSPAENARAGRTLRALKAANLAPEEIGGWSPSRFAEALSGEAPCWLVRAGAWPCGRFGLPPHDRIGPDTCLVGAVRPEPGTVPDDEAVRWSALQAATGGAFSRAAHLADDLPTVASVLLGRRAVAALLDRVSNGEPVSRALRTVLLDGRRLLRLTSLDVHWGDGLRVLQAVTSLQRGGAERVALDLASGLERLGVRSRLVALGTPTRAPFPASPGALDLSAIPGGREARLRALGESAVAFGADLVHVHLLRGEEIAALARAGLPVVATVHNTRPGWPPGTETLAADDALLLIACSQAVEADLRAAALPIPIRTIWNGVNFAPLERTTQRIAAAAVLRRAWGCGPDDFVLLSLANPRPQKRLERLPAIVAALQTELRQRGRPREVRLIVAGEASSHPEAQQSLAELQAEIDRCEVRERFRFVGAVAEVAELLAASDVLVSVSAHEGLSLAHLEALAAGRPVVATDAGGTREIATGNPAMTILPTDVSAERFAAALADVAAAPPAGGREAASAHFTDRRMVERHAWLYPRALARARRNGPGDGLFLVINNFSTGGAQSSARRLLLGAAERGIRVRAAVLQEHPDHPTPGRRALLAAGVDVVAVPPPGEATPAEAVALLLDSLDADPPQVVLFWNALTEHKVLLADALLDRPVFDVSPGEMYHESLARFFERPRPGLPYRDARDYGARLAGLVVKYAAEADQAAALGAPVHVVPNGVPLGPPPVRRRETGRLVIGTAARISPRKRLEDLLAALRLAAPQLPPYVLRIAGGVESGSADYAAELRRQAEGLAVEWVGEPADVRAFLDGLDLFAQVSEPAGCPNASLEAMAAGLPIVATDFGGASEQVVDGVTGRLVPPRDPGPFAAALVELAHDAGQRRAWGDAGRARAETRFNVRRMVDDYLRICGLATGRNDL